MAKRGQGGERGELGDRVGGEVEQLYSVFQKLHSRSSQRTEPKAHPRAEQTDPEETPSIRAPWCSEAPR